MTSEDDFSRGQNQLAWDGRGDYNEWQRGRNDRIEGDRRHAGHYRRNRHRRQARADGAFLSDIEDTGVRFKWPFLSPMTGTAGHPIHAGLSSCRVKR